MRRLFRFAYRAIAALIALPILFYIASFAGALLPGGGGWADDPPQIRIGLLRGPIHYDLLLPLDSPTRSAFAFAEKPAAFDPVWLVVGWGSQGFYTSTGTYADIRFSTAFNAATGDTVVIRIDRFPEIPEPFPYVTWIDLSQRQYDALRQGILNDLTRDAAGLPLPHPAQGFTATDSFWQAQGRFSLLTPCNQWISRQLRNAGVPFGHWTPTLQSVDLSLWWNARPQTGTAPVFMP